MAQSSNVVVAAIHGIVERADTNTPGVFLPGEKKSYYYALTNRANRAETNLVLMLTNYQTNNFCGVWSFDIFAGNVLSASTNSGFALSSAFRKSLTNRIPPGSVFTYRLDVTASASPDPDCSLNLQFVARVATNATGYTAFGERYGGRTNIVNTIAASTALPLVTLTKSVASLTNRRFGGNALTPGCEITYDIRFTNEGNGPGRHLRIIDILPARYLEIESIEVSNLTGFATNFGLSYSSVSAGGSWTGLPEGIWNSNQKRVQFYATNDLLPPGGTGGIRYKVRIR